MASLLELNIHSGQQFSVQVRETCFHLKVCWGDFAGGPVAKTSPSNAEDGGTIPGLRAKIPHASWPKKQNIKRSQYCNKFNKRTKNSPKKKKQ